MQFVGRRSTSDKADSVNVGLCGAYPSDGRWSNRIVSKINNREMTFGPDQSFEIVIGGSKRPGNWILLDDDAVALITRDYLVDPVHGTQATYTIEAVDPAPPPAPPTDADMAVRLRRTANFIRDLLNVSPVPTPFDPNTVQEPYVQQAVTFMCTYDYRYHRSTVNGGQVRYEPDGSWRDSRCAAGPRAPELALDGGPRAGAPVVPVVLARRRAGAAGGARRASG